MMRCLAPVYKLGAHGCDNMTVVLVCFLQNDSYEMLGEKCKREPIQSNKVENDSNMNANLISQYLSSGIQLTS